LQNLDRERTIVMMDSIFRGLRTNWNAMLALCLVLAVIAIYLGPGYFFLTWFFGGCGYIIHIALKR
jgi:hypothetical protein